LREFLFDAGLIVVIVPASMLFATAAARHYRALQSIQEDARARMDDAKRKLDAFRGF
jgi:hypothetical protein